MLESGAGGGGGKRFLWATSDDGGATWATPRPHPDLLTPVCQGSLTGYNGSLFFVGPYSTVARHNLTVLASDNNGASFTRSLLLWPGKAFFSVCIVLQLQDFVTVRYDTENSNTFVFYPNGECALGLDSHRMSNSSSL